MSYETIKQRIQETINTQERVMQELIPKIDAAAQMLVTSLKRGNKILICGNGGSAAQSQHFSAELMIKYEKERQGLAAISLTTDTSTLTAGANDFDYNKVFQRQVEALGKEGDVLVGITTSGDNGKGSIVNAFEAAKKKSMTRICLNGKSGGRVNELHLESNIIIPSMNVSSIQETHIMIIHIWCKIIDDAFSSV